MKTPIQILFLNHAVVPLNSSSNCTILPSHLRLQLSQTLTVITRRQKCINALVVLELLQINKTASE